MHTVSVAESRGQQIMVEDTDSRARSQIEKATQNRSQGRTQSRKGGSERSPSKGPVGTSKHRLASGRWKCARVYGCVEGARGAHGSYEERKEKVDKGRELLEGYAMNGAALVMYRYIWTSLGAQGCV